MPKSNTYTPLTADGEYALLVQATKALRAEIRKATGLDHRHYYRVYTEPRAYGLRTKYYWCMHDYPRLQVRKYIADNPVLKVKDSLYHVSVKPLDTGMAVYLKKLNTTTKTH